MFNGDVGACVVVIVVCVRVRMFIDTASITLAKSAAAPVSATHTIWYMCVRVCVS